MRIHCIPLLFVIATCCSVPVLACGPTFPNSFLLSGNEGRVLVMPQLDFTQEFQRLVPAGGAPAGGGVRWERTLAAEVLDLRAALAEIQVPTEQVDVTVERYIDMRRKIKRHYDGHERDTDFWSTKRKEAVFEVGMEEPHLDGLPLEFLHYAKGAAAYRANDTDQAIRHWNALLELPEIERRYRSVWAAFMLGKVWLKIEPARAAPHFEETRALAGRGFHDSLGLAERSWGWQGFAECRLGRHSEAMHCYVRQYEAVADYDTIESLNGICRGVMRNQDIPSTLVTDPLSRRILTAWILSKDARWKRYAERWFDACERAGFPMEPDEADHMAWVAYKVGHFQEARELLNRSERHCLAGNWVLAKILLREGEIDEGLEVLRGLVAHFPTGEIGDVRAHLGILQLGRQEYVKALDMLARSGYWTDTAYVAERVLTIQELEGYLNRHQDDGTLARCRYRVWQSWSDHSVLKNLNYLLARRLARDEQWEKAERYYPSDLKETYRRYWLNLSRSRDETLPSRKRAEGLFIAARLTREQGMELLGTEVHPDWRMYDGVYRQPGANAARLADGSPTLPEGPQALIQALSASSDEKRKAMLHLPTPATRFHYRRVAADLMWECAELSPDNDPLTAAALYYGGVYLKGRDPKKADRYYKALVRRCGKLPFGQEADRRRWFPGQPPPDPTG